MSTTSTVSGAAADGSGGGLLAPFIGARRVQAGAPAVVEVGDDTPLWGHLVVAVGWAYLAGLTFGVLTKMLAGLPGSLGQQMTEFTGPGGDGPGVIWSIAQVVTVGYLLFVIYRTLRRRPDLVVLADDKVYVIKGLRRSRDGDRLSADAVHELDRDSLRRSTSLSCLITGSFRVHDAHGAFFKIRGRRSRALESLQDIETVPAREIARRLFPSD
ncbi:MAG: hypothetical protein KDK91_16320 [Gammaproteobacteria bacterium]|nr:hypothetical protein [Gammaproteobacteria bacterium]